MTWKVAGGVNDAMLESAISFPQAQRRARNSNASRIVSLPRPPSLTSFIMGSAAMLLFVGLIRDKGVEGGGVGV